MHPLARRVLFLLFLGGFLVAAPAVVLYTSGYRLNPGGGFVQTGVLSVETVPTGARVRVDGRLLAGSTPLVVQNVVPGMRDIEIERAGYLPWRKRLPVRSRETTFVNRTVLYADAPAVLASPADVSGAAADPGAERTAFSRSQGVWTEVWTHEGTTGTERLIARLPGGAAAGTVSLSWSPNGSALAVYENGAVSLVDVRTGRRTEPPPGRPLGWDAGAGARFLTTDENGIAATDAASGASAAFAPPAAAAVSTPSGVILVQPTNEHVALARQRTSDPPAIIAYLPLGDWRFAPAPAGVLLLHDAARERLAVVDPSGTRAPLLNVRAVRWVWEPNGRRLLYSDGYDLHVFDPAGTDEMLTRLSEPITGLAWHPAGTTVLFTQHTRLAAVELDGRGGRPILSLADGEGLAEPWLDRRGRAVFFFGTVDGQTGLFQRPVVR